MSTVLWAAFWTIVVTAVLAVLILITPVEAHGDADWIRKGGYVGKDGVHCCSERDCKPLLPGDVKATAAGYYIRSRDELVPYADAQASEDHRYWLCLVPTTQQRRCFFHPAAGV